MKASGGPQKLRFTVHACSGEDSDYPVRELLYHSPQTRGWQSPRFCKFPQELVLRLERPSKVQQIQILAHEFKIPTKVEVFVGLAGGGGDAAAAAAAAPAPPGGMRRLGYLSFDSNERSEHQARELKSVHVAVEAQLVRLVIHRCHVNKLNIYNQVGIVALNLIGELLPTQPEGPLPFLASEPASAAAGAGAGAGGAAQPLPYYNRAAGEVADLQLDVHVDAHTAARIRELSRAKEAAVAAEDYDEAKRLKACIERLKVVGGKVAQLEARKRLAVEREDYDLAKALKADIEKLRAAGEGAAGAACPPGVLLAGAQRPDTLAAAGGADTGIAGLGDAARAASPAGGGDLGASAAAEQYDQQAFAGADADGLAGELAGVGLGLGLGAGAADGFRGGVYDAAAAAAAAVAPVVHTYQAYEDRPAVAKGAYAPAAGGGAGAGTGGSPGAAGAAALDSLDSEALMRADPSRVSAAAMFGGGGGAMLAGGGLGGGGLGGGGGAAAGGGPACAAPAPAGWPSDLPAPEPLEGSSAKEAEPVAELGGEYVAAAFFSRSWQLRDAAAAWLSDLVGQGGLSGAAGGDCRETARALVRLAIRGLKDKVPQVYASCLRLLQALLAALAAGGGGGRDVAQALEAALPVLLDRLADNNARLRDAAHAALVSIAHDQEEGAAALKALTGQLCRPPKSQAAWRPVLAMLQLLQELVPLLGLAAGGGRGGAADGGFDLAEVMEYVGRALSSANADVRAAALRVAVAVAGCAPGGPAAVRRLLPRDLNPKLREQADAALGVGEPSGSTPGSAAQRTPAAARARADGTGSGSGTGARSAGKPSGHPNRQSAAAASAPPARVQQQQQQQHRQPPQQQQRQQQQQQRQQPPQQQQQQQQQQLEQPLGLLDAADDPAPYAAELAAREAQYGPDHPAVAESCSNLAIVHNQRGDYAAALPLYQRALSIYEASYGPDHQEVAHTLTDLAVLHLEQGHDAVGRPLLERALAIQEAALGPDHPDVVAIRDVLASE